MPSQVIIDGEAKLFKCTYGLTDLSVKRLYSEWKEWLLENDDNPKFLPAFKVIGGEPTIGSNIITPYFFLQNGWRVRPHENNHTLAVDGILIVEGGGDVFINTLGTWRVGINAIVPIYTETVLVNPEDFTASIDAQDVRDAMALAVTPGTEIQIDSIDNMVDRIDRTVQK